MRLVTRLPLEPQALPSGAGLYHQLPFIECPRRDW